jgi:ABC-2 type transport system permease protein
MSAVLVEVFALAGRRLSHLRNAPGRLVGITLNSLITMFAVGYLFGGAIVAPGTGNYLEYLLAGAAAQVGLASVAPTAVGVAVDLNSGLTDRLRSMPISRGAVLVGHTIGDFVVGLMALAVVAGAGYLSGWRIHTGFGPALAGFALLAAFIYVMIWVGVLLGMSLRNVESIDSLGGIAVVVLSFLSNAMISTDRMPAWIRPIAEWNPVSSVTTACRELWGNPVAAGTGFPAQNPGVVLAVTLVVVLTVATLWSFRRYRVVAAV